MKTLHMCILPFDVNQMIYNEDWGDTGEKGEKEDCPRVSSRRDGGISSEFLPLGSLVVNRHAGINQLLLRSCVFGANIEFPHQGGQIRQDGSSFQPFHLARACWH